MNDNVHRLTNHVSTQGTRKQLKHPSLLPGKPPTSRVLLPVGVRCGHGKGTVLTEDGGRGHKVGWRVTGPKQHRRNCCYPIRPLPIQHLLFIYLNCKTNSMRTSVGVLEDTLDNQILKSLSSRFRVFFNFPILVDKEFKVYPTKVFSHEN